MDGVYGHQYIARRNVAKALAAKVFDGVFDLGEAKDVATQTTSTIKADLRSEITGGTS